MLDQKVVADMDERIQKFRDAALALSEGRLGVEFEVARPHEQD